MGSDSGAEIGSGLPGTNWRQRISVRGNRPFCKLSFIEHILYAQRCSKYLIDIISSNPLCISTGKIWKTQSMPDSC